MLPRLTPRATDLDQLTGVGATRVQSRPHPTEVPTPMDKPWTVQDALDLYSIPAWSGGHFDVLPDGDLAIAPEGAAGPRLSLKRLADDLQERGIGLPVLVRCSDILKARVERVNQGKREYQVTEEPGLDHQGAAHLALNSALRLFR